MKLDAVGTLLLAVRSIQSCTWPTHVPTTTQPSEQEWLALDKIPTTTSMSGLPFNTSFTSSSSIITGAPQPVAHPHQCWSHVDHNIPVCKLVCPLATLSISHTIDNHVRHRFSSGTDKLWFKQDQQASHQRMNHETNHGRMGTVHFTLWRASR